MDCGAYKSNDLYVVRIRGSEYGLSLADITELFWHIQAVYVEGADESMSQDYKDCPEPKYMPPEEVQAGGKALLARLGLAKKPIGIQRRF